MITGLDLFTTHFAEYSDRYVLIGGTASWLLLDDAGLTPRATKDLDIVLCFEAFDADFAQAFWDFVKQGDYDIREKSTGEKVFYRFQNPQNSDYPKMLELFSRKPDELVLGDDAELTPIPVGEDISSLSAILLDDDYYQFLHQHKTELQGAPIIDEYCLIPLKARAWLDLSRRKAAGESIDSKTIKKHKSDVLRLYQLLTPSRTLNLPETIQKDVKKFLDAIASEVDAQQLKTIGIKGESPKDVLTAIAAAYGI